MKSTRPPMNFGEVVSRVALRTGLSEVVTADVIEEFIGVVAESLIEFRPIKAKGLFSTNPSAYKTLMGPVLKVNFSLGENLRRKINERSLILRSTTWQ